MSRPFAITSRLGAEHRAALEDLLFFNRLQGTVRTRIVATIDNLPREKIATRIRPVPPIAGAFTTAGAEAELTLNPVNNARY